LSVHPSAAANPQTSICSSFPHRNSPRTPIAKYTCTIGGEKEGNSNKLTIATIISGMWDRKGKEKRCGKGIMAFLEDEAAPLFRITF
jgi:hypothetical protein